MQQVQILILFASLLIVQINSEIGAIDLSNVDLKKFKYFKNLPSDNSAEGRSIDPILEHVQKKKAILEYLGRLLLGNGLYGPAVAIEFNPRHGEERQPLFERTYGKQAERLIELLGRGASEEELKYYGAISNDFRPYVYLRR